MWVGSNDVLCFKIQYACLPVAVLHRRVQVVDVDFCVYSLDLISSHTISYHLRSSHTFPCHLI